MFARSWSRSLALDVAVRGRQFCSRRSRRGPARIHLAMVPSHWGESVAEGIGFAVTGWLQLVFAAVVLTRPSCALLWLGAGAQCCRDPRAWIVSRTAGLPFGAHSGHAETAGFIDITCVVFEAGSSWRASRSWPAAPSGRTIRVPASRSSGSSRPLGVLALTTAALASPGACTHAADSHGETAAGSGGGHTHGTPAVGGGGSGGHTHALPAGTDADKGF